MKTKVSSSDVKQHSRAIRKPYLTRYWCPADKHCFVVGSNSNQNRIDVIRDLKTKYGKDLHIDTAYDKSLEKSKLKPKQFKPLTRFSKYRWYEDNSGKPYTMMI